MGLVLTYDYPRIISFILNSEKTLNTLKQFPTFTEYAMAKLTCTAEC